MKKSNGNGQSFTKYKVGDKIVELGQVFKIFKIKRKKNGDGKFEKIVYFKPYFEPKHSQNFVCSIPIENIDKTDIRKPISRKEALEILAELKKRKRDKELPSITKLKENLKSNEPESTVLVVRTLAKEKYANPDSFTKSKKDVLEEATERLVEEIAVATGSTLKTAREKINTALPN